MTISKRRLWIGLIGVAVAAAALFAVTRRRPPPSGASALPGDSKMLAHVNGSPITEYDVNQAVESSLGPYSRSQLPAEARHTVLESLVASRAIAQAEEASLSAERRAVMDRKVAVYREQALVTEYLNEHAALQPVTDDMVKEYYAAHRDKFGAGRKRWFELITSERTPNQPERDAIILALKGASEQKDWKAFTDTLRKQGRALAFRDGEVDDKTLDARLVKLLASLEVGKTSALSFIDGRAYLARISREVDVPGRPLSEVASSIRQLLAPEQVKKALKAASDRVLPAAKIEYP